jgi:valyl-tRNA synthetase
MISFADENVESLISNLQMTVGKFRSQFAALQIAKSANPDIFIRSQNAELRGAFSAEAAVFKSLIRSGDVTILNAENDPEGCLKSYINDDISIYIKVVGVIDINLEIDRVLKRNSQLDKFIDGLVKKIEMKGYENKVPEAVRKENNEKLLAYKTEIESNLKGIADLKKFI